LLVIVNDILDFSKIEAGKLTIENCAFDLPQAVRETVDLLAPQASERGLALVTEIDPAVPRHVIADPGRIRQILLNLAGNAVKFTHTGTVVVRVTRLGEWATNGKDDGAPLVTFMVTDTGIGIAPEKQARLFNWFTQGDGSSTRRYPGTGLGLAISRRLVELMHGTIGVESVPGEGSRFWFTVPLRLAASAEVNGPPEPHDAPALADVQSDGPLAHGRVLLAEDNVVNQKVATRMLEKLGCRIDVVANGLEAVEAVKRVPYDLILMDCQMPELDGFGAAARIREHERSGRHTPIVALTASVLESDRKRCLAAGMDDFLAKPVSLPTIAGALRRWCDGDGASTARGAELSA
jgi:CheY-like chemotaxis protein